MGWLWHLFPVLLWRTEHELIFFKAECFFLCLCTSAFSFSVSASVACLLSVLVVCHFDASLPSFALSDTTCPVRQTIFDDQIVCDFSEQVNSGRKVREKEGGRHSDPCWVMEGPCRKVTGRERKETWVLMHYVPMEKASMEMTGLAKWIPSLSLQAVGKNVLLHNSVMLSLKMIAIKISRVSFTWI